MNSRQQALADALSVAKKASQSAVVKSSGLDRGVRERLMQAGYLEEVMRGWYLLTTPAGKGTTTLWYSSFWSFIKIYLSDRFGEEDYCLSAESSLELHSGQTRTPKQLNILTKKPSNQVVELIRDTSLILVMDKNFPTEIEKVDGMNVMPLPHAICRLSPRYFAENSLHVEIAFKLIRSVSDLSRILLQSGTVASANRIAGVFKQLGEEEKSAQIVKDMAAVGFLISPSDPFRGEQLYLRGATRLTSPYVGRIAAMWAKMRPEIIRIFPAVSQKLDNKQTLKIIERLYSQDAYHSLSIEGYQVTEDMIEKIKRGKWNPDIEKQDIAQKDAMAAKGYLLAFNAVCESVNRAINGTDAAEVLESDLQNWYRELFTPSIQAGILQATQLSGYRNAPVYIKGAQHVPPPREAVVDSMEALFSLLRREKHPGVRAILGHFIFVFIHPYLDGNGRIGRFILNLMLASGGYHWTVIRVSERTRYMASLEEASCLGNIIPFTRFVIDEMTYWNSEIDRIIASESRL